MSRSAFDMVSAWASVLATTKLDAPQARRDHVVDGVAAAAAHAEHGDARLQLGDVRLLQIDRHGPSPLPFLPLAAAAADCSGLPPNL
jgi:hypothetical protein